MPQSQERLAKELRNTKINTPLSGDGKAGRIDLGGVLSWTDPGTQLFRDVLNHPKLKPAYTGLLGAGYRMDHMPFIIAQNKGSEGFSLHGGVIDVDSGEYNHPLTYSVHNGTIRNNLLACSVVLSDHPQGSGGFVVVPGSHKSNFKAPQSMINGEEGSTDFVVQPNTKAGDVILFSEGTVHGARPWTLDHQRRVALYRFAPPTCSYGRSYMDSGLDGEGIGLGKGWPADIYPQMNDEQKAVLLPPFAVRLDRVTLPDEGGTKVESRSAAKKAHDKNVFGTDYF
jgi:hypothetical protein